MFRGLLRTMRPHQWVKNLFVVLPLVFAKGLLDGPMVARTLVGFVCFCLLASSVYVLNDLHDAPADRVHPTKRNRPIASGVVSTRSARVLFAVLVLGALGLGAAVGAALALVLAGYLVLNVAYTFSLKRVPYVDVLCIATGFELRVLGGAAAAFVQPTAYLLLVTFVLASFLGFGKRMHELLQGEQATKQRAVLERYGEGLLRALLYGTGVATVALYVLYSIDPHTRRFFGTDHLVYSSAFAAIGVGRFVQLVMRKHEAESPTEEMLRDRWFLLNLAAWGVTVVATIYAGNA